MDSPPPDQNLSPPASALPQPEAEAKSFKRLFCERHRCPEEQFEKIALFRYLHDQGRFLGKMFWRWRPGFFEADLALLRIVGEAVSFREFQKKLMNFYEEKPPQGFWREWLKVRVSGKKLAVAARKSFGSPKPAAAVAPPSFANGKHAPLL